MTIKNSLCSAAKEHTDLISSSRHPVNFSAEGGSDRNGSDVQDLSEAVYQEPFKYDGTFAPVPMSRQTDDELGEEVVAKEDNYVEPKKSLLVLSFDKDNQNNRLANSQTRPQTEAS